MQVLCYFNYYHYSSPTKLSNWFNTIIDLSLDATRGDRQISLSDQLKLTLKHPKIFKGCIVYRICKKYILFSCRNQSFTRNSLINYSKSWIRCFLVLRKVNAVKKNQFSISPKSKFHLKLFPNLHNCKINY